MKTRILLPTLLALSIQVMVNSQTQGNSPRRILSLLDGDKKEIIIRSTSTPNKKETKKIYPTLISSEENKALNKPEQTVVIDNNTFNYYNNTNCYSTMIYASQLLKEADDLALIEKTLRAEAKTKQGEEKNKLIKAAGELFKQAELKQIQASEITGKVNVEKFKKNEIVFNNMVFTSLAGETIIEQAKEIDTEANHNLKMAKEMREEAYAMPGNTAKLGTMSNAEEKETIALSKQNQAIGILKQYAANVELRMQNQLATK